MNIDKFFSNLTYEKIKENFLDLFERYLENDKKYIVKLTGKSISSSDVKFEIPTYYYIKSYTQAPFEFLHIHFEITYKEEILASYEARYDENGRLIRHYIEPIYVRNPEIKGDNYGI